MNWMEEAYYIRLPSGPPSQGDLWSNLPRPYSEPAHCTGLLITPRCDLVHDKSPVINYLPVVSLNELIESQGGFALLEREIHRSRGALRQIAEFFGVSDLLDVDFPAGKILEVIERAQESSTTDRKEKQARKEQQISSFRSCLSKIYEIEARLDKPRLLITDIESFTGAKALEKYQREAMLNRLADVHFLPPCPTLFRLPIRCTITPHHYV